MFLWKNSNFQSISLKEWEGFLHGEFGFQYDCWACNLIIVEISKNCYESCLQYKYYLISWYWITKVDVKWEENEYKTVTFVTLVKSVLKRDPFDHVYHSMISFSSEAIDASAVEHYSKCSRSWSVCCRAEDNQKLFRYREWEVMKILAASELRNAVEHQIVRILTSSLISFDLSSSYLMDTIF